VRTYRLIVRQQDLGPHAQGVQPEDGCTEGTRDRQGIDDGVADPSLQLGREVQSFGHGPGGGHADRRQIEQQPDMAGDTNSARMRDSLTVVEQQIRRPQPDGLEEMSLAEGRVEQALKAPCRILPVPVASAPA